jgi:Domain of unknown function (DUF4203)
MMSMAVWADAHQEESTMDFLIGIIAIACGLAICFAGLRLWFILLPIFGFLIGFSLAATAVASLWDDHVFLAGTSAVIAGLIVGIIFALIAYFWWYFGVILAAGFVGASLASGLAQAINIDADWALFIFAMIGGILFVAGAFLLALPVFIVIVNSAIGGGVIIIAGLLLVFNRLDYENLGYGTAWAAIDDSWWWTIVLIVLAAAGIFIQMMSMAQTVLPEEKWVPANAGTQPATS